MSSAKAGPSMPPAVASSKKHRKEQKQGQSTATSYNQSIDGGDASMRSTDPRKEEKRRRKEEKKAAKRLAKQNATSTQKDADIEDENGGSRDSDVRKWKGKGSAQSAFRTITSVVDLPIPPVLCQNPRKAADELIDTMLMRYVPQFGGVLICHTDSKFLKKTATIDADGAFSVAPTRLTCLVWAPRIGMRLEGRITLSTPSHVSLLVHGIFNASITSAHLPSVQEAANMRKEDGLTWREFPIEVEEEAMQEDGEDGGDDDAGALNDDEFSEKSTGYWENAMTGERLGGKDATVVFTVVGLTIANHMLSIHGSLLRKPFSIPAPTYVPTTKEQREAAVAAATAESTRRVRFQEELKTQEFATFAAGEDDEDDGEEDAVEAMAANVVTPIEVQTVDRPANVSGSKKRRSTGKDGPNPDESLEGEKRSKKKSKKH